MKKILTAVLTILFIMASFGGTISAAAQNGSRSASEAARATEASAQAEMELLLPASYEQYLELENPSDFAICDDYIAVADRNNIYVYSEREEIYRKYTHSSENILSSLNFYAEGGKTYLYFLENSALQVYYIDCTADTYAATETSLDCSSFIIVGNELYFAKTGQDVAFFKTALEGTDISAERTQLTLTGDKPQMTSITPAFSYCGKTLYFSYNSIIYSVSDSDTNARPEPWKISTSIQSFAVYGNKVYYSTTSETKDFYVFENGDAPLEENGERITQVPAIELFGDTLYYIQGQSVQTLLPASGEFTDYEISKNSADVKRLNGASDVSAYGNKLAIADTGNRRVLIYDTDADRYTQFPLKFSPTLICAGENTFAVSDGDELFIYDYTSAEKAVYSYDFDDPVVDFAYSFGSYYLITGAADGHCVLSPAEDGYVLQSPQVSFNTVFDSIAADMHGKLYLMNDGAVYPIEADKFLTENVAESILAFNGADSLLSDFEGNLFALSDTAISRYDQAEKTIASIPIVNNASEDKITSLESAVFSENTPVAISFAFGYENDAVYILSDGFIVKADMGTNAPASLNAIGAENLYSSLHGPLAQSEAEEMLVAVPDGSVVLRAQKTAIGKDTKVFPYDGYEKTDSERLAVRVCDTDAGTIVAFFEYAPAPADKPGEAPLRAYSLGLVLGGRLQTAEGFTAEEQAYTGYATNEVGLYRYPLMKTGEDTLYSDGIRLKKSAQMIVLGKMSSPADDSISEDSSAFGLDADYLFVRVANGEGYVYGFVPASYVAKYDTAASWENKDFTYRNLKKGASITLQNDAGGTLTLSDKERVKVYGEADKDNKVFVTYEKDGAIWSGTIDADLLYDANASSLVVLLIVMLVTAAILSSTCYLILRRQPTLQS